MLPGSNVIPLKAFGAILAAAFLSLTSESAQAISFGKPGGDWPKSWPQELEPFRKQAWTWEHGFGGMSYDIPFTNRAEFESAWPHILKLKNRGAAITIRSGPHLRLLKEDADKQSAGVIIRLPHEGATDGVLADTRIELIVDGKIVDLNRIRLPIHTPIVDTRFNETKKSPKASHPTATASKPQ